MFLRLPLSYTFHWIYTSFLEFDYRLKFLLDYTSLSLNLDF